MYPISSKIIGSYLGLFFVILIFLTGIHLARAASVYNVVETTGTVGVSATFELEYTVDTTQQTWADADTLTITLPANFTATSPTFTLEYDTDVDNNSVGETAITAGVGSGQFIFSGGNLITVKWNLTSWGAVVNNASTIRVFVTANPSFENASSTFTFGGSTAAADTNPSGSDTVNVSAADAAASLTLALNSVVGNVGNTVLTVNLASKLTANDTVVFTAPNNLNVAGVVFGSETFVGSGTFSSCSASGQVVTCTANGQVGPGSGDLLMTGILSRYVASSQTITSVAVNDSDQAGADIARDSSGTVTNTTVGSLLSSNIDPEIFVYNIASINHVSFTTQTSIPNGGSIRITYSSSWNVSAIQGQTAQNLSGLDGTWTASVSGQVVTLTQTGGGATAAGTISFTLDGNGIVAPSQYEGGTYTVLTRTNNGEDIENMIVTQDFFFPGTKGPEIVIGQVKNFSVEENPEGGVLIRWALPGSPTTAVDLYRSLNPEQKNAVLIQRFYSDTTRYVDPSVPLGQDIAYFIRATDGQNYGPFSNELIIRLEVPVEGTGDSDEYAISSESETNGTETNETSEIDVPEENVSEAGGSEESVAGESVEGSTGGMLEENFVFTDIVDEESKEAIQTLAELSIVQGNPDGSFSPDRALNKAELSAFLSRFIDGNDQATVLETPYKDVVAEAWYAPYVAHLYDLELLDLRLTAYQPAKLVSHKIFFDFIEKLMEYLEKDSLWICESFDCEAKEPISRSEASEVLYDLYQKSSADAAAAERSL